MTDRYRSSSSTVEEPAVDVNALIAAARAKPYHRILVADRDADGREGWVAEVQEFPGCLSQGATPNEAMEQLDDAMAGWISIMVEHGNPIPEPFEDPAYSGRFLTRIPPSLHALLVREAQRESVSLNQFVTAVLAGAVGWRGQQSA